MNAKQAANAAEFRNVYRTRYKTKTWMVWEYLKRYGTITQQEALEAFDCYRLAARIADLKQKGERIGSAKTKGGYAQYYIIEEEKDERREI